MVLEQKNVSQRLLRHTALLRSRLRIPLPQLAFGRRLRRLKVSALRTPFRLYSKASKEKKWQHINATLQTLGRCSTGNKVFPFYNSGDAFRAMWDAVDAAKESVLWQTYICKDDNIGQITVKKLIEAKQRGCSVQLVYDCGGNITGRERLFAPLREAGASVLVYRPMFTHTFRYFVNRMNWEVSPAIRCHRKILIVDGRIGFTGGLNIGNDYAAESVGGNGRFRDTMCRVEGPAVSHLLDVYYDTIHTSSSTSHCPIFQQSKLSVKRWRQWVGLVARFRRALITTTPTPRTQFPHYFSDPAVKRRALHCIQQIRIAARRQRMRMSRTLSEQSSGAAAECSSSERPSDASSMQPDHEVGDVATQILMCNPKRRDWSLQMSFWLVTRKAHARVWVTTPYCLPARKLTNALLSAASRGLDVRVLTGSTQTTDPWFMWYASQHLVHRLLRAGVKVYEFEEQGLVMHAKTIVADSVWSSIGSYNWDVLSNKVLEATLATYNPEIAAVMETHFLRDLVRSSMITEEIIAERPLRVRAACWMFYHVVKVLENFWFLGYRDKNLTSMLN